MVTTGTLMLGNSSAFRRVKATRPSTTMAEMTIRMNTGRVMATRVRPMAANLLQDVSQAWREQQRRAGGTLASSGSATSPNFVYVARTVLSYRSIDLHCTILRRERRNALVTTLRG